MKKITSCILVVLISFLFSVNVFAAEPVDPSDFVADPKCFFDGVYQHDFIFLSPAPDSGISLFGVMYEVIYDPDLFSIDIVFSDNRYLCFDVDDLTNLTYSLPIDVNYYIFPVLDHGIFGETYTVDYAKQFIYFSGLGEFFRYQIFPGMLSTLTVDPASYMVEASLLVIPEEESSTSSGLPVAPTDPIEDVGGTLPVEDPSFVVGDDGASSDVIDGSNAVFSILQWLVSVFRKIVFFWIRL